MPALRSLIAILFLGLCLASPPLLAQSEPPSAEAVQQSLDKLAERKLAEADQKVAKASLEQTLKFLAARDEALQSLEDLKKRLSDAPRQIEENQRELERLKKTKERPVSERYSGESAARLEMLLNDRTTQQAEWQKALGEANSLSITAETRPERAQAGISSMQARILEIGSLLKAGKESGKTINADRRGELLAEQAALTVQSQLLRQELAGNNLLQDLGKSQHDLLTEKISRLEKETLDLQALISEKRREQSEKTVAELSKEGAQGAGTDSLLSQENAKNLRLSDYLLRATDRLNVLTRRNLETKQQLDNLTQSNQALEEQINVLRGSLLLSRILYKQKQALPKIKADQSLADEIADLRLGQFELNQERDKLATPQQYLDDLLAQQPSEQVTPELRKDLDTLLATRSELLERLNHELNALLNEAITLQLNQKQLLSTSESLRTTLDEQMFWIPSNQPLDLSWFKMTPTLLKNQLTEIPWGSGVRELGEGLVDRPLLFLPLFLLIAALLWKRRYLYDKLAELNDDIGHFKRDSQLHTPLAILITILLALPGTLTFAVAGLALLLDARGQNATLGSALLEMAQVWLLFYTAHRILTPGGIAERHFHWSREQVGFLDRHLVRLGVVVLALVGVVTVAEHQPASLADDVIGIAVVLLGYAAMAWLLSRLLFSSPGDERPSLIKMIVGILFTALPLVLFVAVCFGYYYTSLKLTDRLIDTLYLLLLWFVIEAAFVRGLGVAARRLAYARALAKRQNAAKEGVDGETNVEEPTLGIEQINQQSLRLIRLALLIGFIVCLYWVWADLISVISYLDNVTLYQYTAGTGAQPARPAGSPGTAAPDPGPGQRLRHHHPAFLRHQRHRHRQRPVHPRGQLGQAAMAGGGALGRPRFRPAGDLLQLRLRPDHPLRASGTNRRRGDHRQPVRHGQPDPHPRHHHHRFRPQGDHRPEPDLHHRATGELVAERYRDPGHHQDRPGLRDRPAAGAQADDAGGQGKPAGTARPGAAAVLPNHQRQYLRLRAALPRPRTGRPQPLYRRDPDEDRHQLPRTQDRHGFQPGRCVRQEPPGPAGPAVRRRAAAQRRRQSARAQGPGRSRRTDPLNLRAWTPSGNSQHNARELPEASLEITRRPRLRQPLRPPGRRLLHRSPARPHRRAAPGGSQPRRPGAARPASGNQRRSAVRRTVRRAQAVVGGRAAGDGVFRPPVRLL